MKACSVGFGIFMGIVPIWGFQLLVAIPLAIILKMNKALVILAANISIPPMIPLIIFLSYKTGSYWMGEKSAEVAFDKNTTLSAIGAHLQQYIYGSITLAIIAGLGSGLLTLLLLTVFKRKKTVATL